MSGGYSGLVEPLLDRLGRPLETLRISITDRCNFRCVYCMPKEVFGRDYAFLERRELLTLEELARVAGIFARLGVRTLRITGGEPLVRRNVEHLVELLAAIERPDGGRLELAAPERPDATASRWRYLDGAGEIGVIASVTQPFCGGCSRARLSAEGRLYTCLFAARGHDLRAPLRLGASDEELTEQLRAIWARRTDRYSELRTAETASLPKVEMSYIGG